MSVVPLASGIFLSEKSSICKKYFFGRSANESTIDTPSSTKHWSWRWRPVIASVIALSGGGLLMGLAPVNAWPLAWIALVPLWCVVHHPQHNSRNSLLAAGLWGAAYHGSALSWITGLHPATWLGIPWLESLAIMLFAWAFITLWGAGIALSWTGLMVALDRWQLSRQKTLTGPTRVLVGTTLWCGMEWLWSKGPLYWSSLSYTQSPHNLMGLQLGQLAGPMTVTAAIVAVNGLLAEGYFARKQASQSTGTLATNDLETSTSNSSISNTVSGSKKKRRRYLSGAIALFLGLHLLGWGLYSRPLANDPQAALSVGLVQGNIPTSQKMTTQGVQTSREVYLEGYEALATAGADLVITPEGAIPQTWNAFLQSRDLLQRAVVNNGVPLLLGTFAHQEISNSQSPLTQSLLLLNPGGKVTGRYNKIKLVPLGEYLPLEKSLGWLIGPLSPFGESMVPGSFQQRLETPFGLVAGGICYESAFAELFRQQVDRGGQAIFTASNNDPYPPRQMMQHHALDVMRAIETDRWEVRVTNTGISGVVDPKGRSRWLSTPNEYVAHMAQIYRRQTRTPYVRWGDWLTPLLLAITMIALRR
ncbi:MAG: apolipoprotein N-acyltransferase [Cyanobacteria bacterium P01_F01_bin.53]